MFGDIITVVAVLAIISMYAYVIVDDDNKTKAQRAKQHVRKFFQHL